MFACKNKVIPSALDGLGMGLGFTLALFAMGSIREIFGSGSWMGIELQIARELPFISQPMSVFVMSAGGFFVLGVIIALVNKLAGRKPPQKIGCAGCPNAASCSGRKGGEE